MKYLGFERPLYILPFDHRGTFQNNQRNQPRRAGA